MLFRNRTSDKTYQTYQDGWGTVFEVVDRRIKYIKQKVVHYSDSVVGERRFWDAKVLGVAIDRAVLVPLQTDVEVDDVFSIDGTQYIVRQKQLHDKTAPASWLLSLSESKIQYRSDEDGN